MTSEAEMVKSGVASPSGRFETQQRQIERRSRRAYLKAGALLLLALLAGIVIGIGGTFMYVKSKMRGQQPRADQIGKYVLESMDKAVRLTPAEKTRLEAIILERMAEVDRVRAESLSRIREQFDSMNDEVDEILGPDRSKSWEADKRKRYGPMYRGKEERHHGPTRRERGPADRR